MTTTTQRGKEARPGRFQAALVNETPFLKRSVGTRLSTLLHHLSRLHKDVLGRWDESPTYEPSKLSKMRTYVGMSNHVS